MNIRRGTASDAGSIAALIASFQSQLTDDPAGLGAEQYLASVSEEAERLYLQSTRYIYLVAEERHALLGFIAIRDGTHLFHLFVARSHQRAGMATRLWQAALEAACQGGPAAFTVNSSLNAVPVYEAFGFRATGPVASVHGISFLPMRLEALRHNA